MAFRVVRAGLQGKTEHGRTACYVFAEGPEPEAPVDVIEYAHDRIRARVGAAFREHGLTTLVACLLEAEGFTCLESPPGPDGGVDIIAGRGRMGFDGPRLVVQVKSGERPVGVGVLRELQGVMRSFGAEHGLLVSWSGFNDVVLREARRTWFHLRLWTADDVIEALQAHYERLPEAIRAEIPLQRVWAPVEDPA